MISIIVSAVAFGAACWSLVISLRNFRRAKEQLAEAQTLLVLAKLGHARAVATLEEVEQARRDNEEGMGTEGRWTP